MPVVTLRPFQERAVESGVRLFAFNKKMLDAAATDGDSRATAIHANGYLLIEAPTGAGKTLIAGSIVEKVSGFDNIVWFWFAPFKGVVEQSASFLREQFHGLRLRPLADDRHPGGARTGDAFVTTWQMVATRVKDRRSVRQTGEQNESIDKLVAGLRDQGFRIGVVVDEAHHGFHGETLAAAFFREVLNPEYTILVTATPDDADLEDLRTRMQVHNIHRISISRADAVGPGPEAGLIKSGVRAVAFRADEGTAALVDFEGAALAEAAKVHATIKLELRAAGINLTPLMLVQVDSRPKSVDRAKEKLLALGFSDAQIAVHTADEPDQHLLAIANDESREVLVFKMAVALGFDAPRAWTLATTRATQAENFGVQLVGRILRVHRRLQGRRISDALKYGYVMLADPEAQSGLDKAGQRINQIQTAYASVCATTVIVQVGSRTMVQTTGPDGQVMLAAVPPTGAFYTAPAVAGANAANSQGVQGHAGTLFGGPAPVAPAPLPTQVGGAAGAALAALAAQGRFRYPLRAGVPRRFKSQDVPEDHHISEHDVAHALNASVEELWKAVNAARGMRVSKITIEIFTQQTQLELGYAPQSRAEVQRAAQRALMSNGYFSPKALRAALLSQLHVVLAEKGLQEAGDAERLSHYLDSLLAARPAMLHDAQRKALARAMATAPADDLPEAVYSDSPLQTSRLNVYGVLPVHDFNSWERRFGEFLDEDTTGTVMWWHRNPRQKPWSINVLMETGSGFYPDFIIGIRERPRDDHGLLADTKYAWDTAAEYPKLLAEHARYGRVLVLTKQTGSEGWHVVGVDDTGRPSVTRKFRLEEAARF